MTNEKSLLIKKLNCCEICNYDTYSKKDFGKHLLTLKHKRLIIANELLIKNLENPILFACNCGKEYKHQSSLCKHKKNCDFGIKQEDTSKEPITNTDIIKIILDQSKENKDLKELLIEQNKLMMDMMKNQTLASVTNNNSNNTTNNNFNINLFLNEKCKNALNLMDFVNQIKGNVKDLENIGIMGFVEGISKIFIRELKSLSVYERPIHCTDVKREKLYVKDEDKWEKEEEGKPKIIKAIKYITHHNIKALPQWQKENPLYSDSRSKDNDMHNQIIMQIMTDEEKLYHKIITNVSKNVIIDKENS
jgi:hypothetical protein